MFRLSKVTLFFLICMIVFNVASSMAIVLPIASTPQQQTNWCWAGSTQTIVNFLGKSARQCDMANYLRTVNYWGSDDCCGYAQLSLTYPVDAVSTPGAYKCNQGNYLLYGQRAGNVQEIMSTYGVSTSGVSGALTQADVQTEIYFGRPFMMRWDWAGGGAHALVGYGIVGSMVNWFDPWPWNPQFNSSPYSQLVSDNTPNNSRDHSWTETVKPTNTPAPAVPDILANNNGGSLYVSSSTPVNVTVSLNAGGFTNTQADVWVLATLNGVLYYQNSAGAWTTTAVTRTQGGLATFSPYSIFYGTLPAGTTITFYFVVDLTMNGVFDSPYYYDYVTVTAY